MSKVKRSDRGTMNVNEDTLEKEKKPLPPSGSIEKDVEKLGDTEFRKFIIELLANNEKYII